MTAITIPLTPQGNIALGSISTVNMQVTNDIAQFKRVSDSVLRPNGCAASDVLTELNSRGTAAAVYSWLSTMQTHLNAVSPGSLTGNYATTIPAFTANSDGTVTLT